jgi:hypothetical protein
MALRVFVDYNTMLADDKERVSINTSIFKYLLDDLHFGMPLVLYDEESLEVDAVADYDPEYKMWFGVPDWSTRRELSQLSQEELDRIRKLMDLD